MRSRRFQMYDDANGGSLRTRILPDFPLRNSDTAKLLVMGGRDCLVDTTALMEQLQNATMVQIPEYEHMDPIWAPKC